MRQESSQEFAPVMRRAVIVRRVLPTVVDVGSSLAKACAVAVQLLLLEAVRCGVDWAGCTGLAADV